MVSSVILRSRQTLHRCHAIEEHDSLEMIDLMLDDSRQIAFEHTAVVPAFSVLGVLAPLRKHRFFNYAELNRGLLAKLSELNREPFRGLKVSRRDLYLESERAALRPLPTTRYEFAAFKHATVGIDSERLSGG